MPFINVSPFHEFLSGMNFILQINVGVVKLTGESGTGKTALLQELVRGSTDAYQDIVVFYSAPSSFEQVKTSIREQLGLDPVTNFHDALLNYLLAKPYEQRRLTVVFDNAELMDEETLRAVGHLRSIQHAGRNLIGIVLCGKPELSRRLRNPEHRLLAKDILLSYELSPLSSQQLPDFCRACLSARGLDSLVLVSDDYLQIMQKSGGLPGKVAELVETYWPDDTENGDSNENMPVFPLPVIEPSELMAEVLQEVATAEAERAVQLTPDSQDTVHYAPEPAPANDFPDDLNVSASDVPTDITNFAQYEVATDVLNVVPSDNLNISPSDGQTDNTNIAQYDVTTDISNFTSTDVLSDGPKVSASGVPTDITGIASYEVPAGALNAASSGDLIVSASDLPLDITNIAPYRVPADVLNVAPFDDLNIAPSDVPANTPNLAAQVVPTVPPPMALTRGRMIAGSLLAAGVVIVIALIYMRGTGTDTSATQTVADVEPVPAFPSQVVVAGNTAPNVNVQQFGDAPAAEAPNAAAPAPAATTQSTEVVSQPLVAVAPAPPADTAANIEPANNAAAPTTATSEVASQANTADAAGQGAPADIAATAQAVVTAWTNAWQSQDVTAYLAFYHADFVPPNQASRAAWESNRNRTISSQSSITISVQDFRVVNNSGNRITVQFLLTYRGDSYADRTVKELVLQRAASGELRIVQEQNLQTEVFDPVIEDAASWMPDTGAGARTAATTKPEASQLNPDDAILSAAPTAGTPAPSEPENEEAPALETAVTGTIPLIFNLTSLLPAEVKQINDFLLQWAEAWQSQDTDLYFAHYHADYKAPELATTAAWREERIRKIAAPGRISIGLDELEIMENNNNNILVELLMEYHADAYSDRTLKRMLLTRTAAGSWLITMEKNLEVEKM